jgi:hypothetical protein
VIVLGSFAFMTLGQKSYLESLTYTVLWVGGGVLLFGLAWNPPAGFAGLSVFFSRYLLSIGLPLERWLYFLAGLSQAQPRPERFLAEAIQGLVRLPWIAGARWRWARGEGEAGETSRNAVELTARRCAGTSCSSASCLLNSTRPSCARSSCRIRPTSRQCTKPARASRTR